jgi:hypothetical protein
MTDWQAPTWTTEIERNGMWPTVWSWYVSYTCYRENQSHSRMGSSMTKDMTFNYEDYVRENGLIYVQGLGYISPQMHAEMMRINEQRKLDDAVILRDLCGAVKDA